jgi:SAM-dependent methyltransferase
MTTNSDAVAGQLERGVRLHREALPRVLDPCCGSRMMWFEPQHPDALFGDRRAETLTVTDNSRGNASGTRTIRIEPDTLMDFRALPYPDGAFKLVAFDPPHLVHAGPRSWLAAKYGRLGENWRDDLREGFSECFRVLASDGVLVFKWNETQVKLSEVLALTPHQPLFGNTSGKRMGTHWLVFMKPNVRAKLPAEAALPCGAKEN